MDKRTLRHQQNELRRNEARSLKQSGLSYSQIGLEMGVTRQRVQQLVSYAPKQRNEIIKNANGICQKCKKETKRLNVHHINYVPDECEVLCNSCHMSLHGRENTKNRIAHRKERVQKNKMKNLIFFDSETKAQLKIISIKYNIPVQKIIIRVWRNDEEKKEFYFSS